MPTVTIPIRLAATAVAGTVDAITATFSPTVTVLTDKSIFVFRATGANASTTPTFKADTTTAKTIVKENNQALVAGDIVGEHFIIYNSTLDKYVLMNPFYGGDSFWKAGAGTNSLMDKRSTTGSGNNGVTAGNLAVNTGLDGQAIGVSASNTAATGQALGAGAANSGNSGQAIGQSAINESEAGQAIGDSANNIGVGGQAIGAGAFNNSTEGQAIGEGAVNSGDEGQAIGHHAQNDFARSTALGEDSVTTAIDQTNISKTLRFQAYTGAGTNLLEIDNNGIVSAIKHPEVIAIACSDLTSNLTTGTSKGYIRMPFAMTLTSVRASVIDAPTGVSLLTVDINEAGSTILSTKITIDASEKTSTTAATAPVISDSALADDAEITVDIDQIGSTNAGKGLIVYLIGTRT